MGGFVYLLTNRRNGAIYTGVTADIGARMIEHRNGRGSKFCAEYGINRLVFVEAHDSIEDAILREKRIKKWRREWKLSLIQDQNPDWRDLFFDLNR